MLELPKNSPAQKLLRSNSNPELIHGSRIIQRETMAVNPKETRNEKIIQRTEDEDDT